MGRNSRLDIEAISLFDAMSFSNRVEIARCAFGLRAVDGVDDVSVVLDDGAEPPRPILRWLRRLTLQGRIPTSHVPVDAILRQ